MSRESRDGHKSHESNNDRRSYHAEQQDDRDEQRSEDESQDAGDSQPSDHQHHRDRDHEAHDESREEHHHHSHDRSQDHSNDEGDAERAGDHSKFASYDDDDAQSSQDEEAEPPRKNRGRYYWERKAERSHRIEPAHHTHGDFRADATHEAARDQGSALPATATRRAVEAAPYADTGPADLTEPMPLASAGSLHPYDNNRAILIGVSTALVTAIAVIVALMINLSTHKDLALSAQKDRKLYEQRWNTANTLAEQRAREAQAAAEQYAQSQRLVQTQQQAYLATQDQLHRQQTVQQQTQAENQRRMYVTQIRLAKQAWDRGDTNEVLRLLEPYRGDPAQQKLCSFAWYYLWRAAHSGGNIVLRGHGDVVRQAVVTPDGSQIVTIADDGQLIVWDSAAGRKLAAVALERNVPPRSSGLIVEDQLARRASGLVIASNGAWAAAYGRDLFLGTNIKQLGAASTVDGPRSAPAALINDHQSPIISLAISPDGRRLASGDYSGEIIIRDVSDGRVLRRFHNPRPQALALSSDGGIIFAGMHDGGLFVWDVNKGSLLGTRAFGDGINSMALSPDATTLALAMGVRDGVVRLWEPSTGRFHGDLRGHHDEVLRVTWSNDGKSILTASRDQTACLWSSAGALLRTFRGHLGDVETVAFTPDGQKVVSAGDDQSAILWNVDGGQPCDMLTDTPVDGWVSGLAFTPDGARVIGTGSCDGAGDSFEAYLTAWNLADADRPEPLQTSSRSGVALAFSPDGRQMAVGESAPPQSIVKSRARIWSLDPARVLATVPKLPGSVYSVAYSNDGRLMAVGAGDIDERVPGSVQIVEPATGALRQKLPDMPGKVEAFFSADSRYVITVSSSKKRPAQIRLWNPLTAELIGQLDSPQELEGLTTTALSPDGRFLLTGHGDPVNPAAADKAKIKVWDMATHQLVGVFPAAHPAAITHLEFSRRGVLLASGDMAGNVRLWDFASRKLMAKQIPSQGRPILHIAFDVLGQRLAVASDEKCLRVWHIDTGRQLAILELSLGVPNVVRYSQDGKLMAAATSAGGLFIWDADSYKPRTVLRGEGNPAGQQGHGGVITCVAPLLTDKLLTGSVDKTVRVWDLKTRKAVAAAYTFNQAVSCMAVSPDGHTLAVGTGKYRSKFETGELVLCALDNRQPQKSISQGITPVSLAFSPDGNSLAVCSLSAAVGQASRTVTVIDLRSGHATPIASAAGQSVAFSPDGRILAVGCTNGDIDLWPLDTPSATKPFTLKKHQGLVWSLAFSPDGMTLASGGADNNVVIWDVPTGEDLMTLKQNGTIEALRFSPDGRLLATAAHEPSRGSVCLWRAPADEDTPVNTLRSSGNAVLNQPASLDSAMAMRPVPADPTAARPAQAAAFDRRAADPAAPMPSNYSRTEDNRYGGAPAPATWSAASQSAANSAATDPSTPLPTSGSQSFNSGSPPPSNPAFSGDGPMATDPQAAPSAGRGSGGRHARPTY